eukprot:257665-Alexandrium_andersonii.AAC.1
MLGGGEDAESGAKQRELESADDPINMNIEQHMQGMLNWLDKQMAEEAELKAELIDMQLAEKAKLEAKLEQFGAVVSTDTRCVSQAAESEARHRALEGAENPINMKGCERVCALAEGMLQNECEGGDSDK